MSNIEKLSRDEIRRRIGLASADNHASRAEWSEPKALPSKLAKVAEFDTEFLPPSIAPWVNDISERLQCPPDYVAVTALTAIGSLIGRRVGIKPQQKTDWVEVPNVGRLHWQARAAEVAGDDGSTQAASPPRG
jgi:hypothetical protein